MTQRLVARILVVALLLSAFFSARQAGAWYCEGKPCGLSLLRCCCQDLPVDQDNNCGKDQAKASGPGVNLCASGCGCVLVLERAPDTSRVTSPGTVWDAPVLLAILPTVPLGYIAPAPIESVTFRIDSRGPPSGRAWLASLAPRAPPAA